MQETALNFTGLALTPYSDASPDGQLSACIGLESHAGALRPSLLAGKEYLPPSGDSGYELIHVHTASAFSHFIFRKDNGVYWAEVSEGQYSPQPVRAFDGLKSVNTVGNTLVVLASDGIHYLLWKEGGYRYIGQKPPEIGLSFGLSVTTYDRASDVGSVSLVPSLDYTEGSTRQILLSDEDGQWQYVTDVVWSAINMAIEACTENNRFCMPFFVRAAYRRFDGSYTMLTSPVLMIPDSTGPKALFVFEEIESKKITGKVYGRAAASLLVTSLTDGFSSDIASWSDIISSIDIFISPQVMRADTSESVNVLYGQAESDLTWHKPPLSYSIGSDGYGFSREDFNWNLGSTTMKFFKIPLKEEDAYLQDLNGSMQFYRVRSISISQLSSLTAGNFFPVLDRGADMANLVQLESLPDSADYQSHDVIVSEHSHVYNQRLHLFDVERKLFGGFLPENAWTWTDDGPGGEITVSVHVAAEDGATRIVSRTSSGHNLSQLGRFLYYPDANATRMVITGGGFSYDLPLQPHPLLNGAFYIFMDTEPSTSSVTQSGTVEDPVKMPNKVYTSEVGNPFYFPLEGIYTVGTGQILGLSSIATALSQGQFGQFPLMIFCSDGNYAMSVNEEGRYSAVHPMQRDVCVNPDAIVQTDSEVIFVSSRGVMITSGASARILSGALDGVPDTVPADLGFSNPSGSPVEFFRDCRIAYDYTNRRIIFFSLQGGLSYVYSIEDDSWSMSDFGAVKAAINLFPYSYVQLADGTVCFLSESYPHEGEPSAGLIYTRPVKMDSLQLKKMFRFFLQGIFSRTQKVSVYGSNDCVSWHCLGHGGSHKAAGLASRTFKYYRFAVRTELDPSENITCLRIHYEPRAERRFR